ncbi:NAD-dependent dihydropyrimidine dehydrogenase subunit PreA [Elusimicrobiota bacterium]
MVKLKDLSIEFCGVKFPNPVMLSSSPVSNTAEMVSRAFECGFGGTVYKSIAHDNLRMIHPSPRMAGYNYGNKKLVGLQNVEQTSDRSMYDNFEDIKYLKKHWPDRVLIVSIMGFSEQEWIELAKLASETNADMLELNFSCPHMTVEGSGMKVAQALSLVEKFTNSVRKVTDMPIIAKLTSNVTDITVPASFSKKGGANGFTAINTVQAITEIGLDDHVPKPNIFGIGAKSGYSGPGIKPIGLRCVCDLAQSSELNLPISGCGGIETWVDVVEYLLCGASTVQITTGVIHYGYRIVEDILEGLSYYMEDRNLDSVADIVGKALPNIKTTDKFNLSRQGIAEYDLERCIGCGQCYIVCKDAGGQCIEWDYDKRRPVPDEKRCLSCMICSFICPISDPPLITYKEVKNKKPVIPEVSK